jgi:hypothetical protein
MNDMSPPVNLLRRHETGPVRVERPVYVDLLPPCNSACPAGEDIQGWLSLAQAGKFEQAWKHLVRDNPMPAVHGRVCYHPCESSCNRADLDSAVSIHAIERFLGDKAAAEGWIVPVEPRRSGKRVLVVGAGPCGLSAAYHLIRLGHQVEIHEAGPLPGGMLHFGIPAYRLPRDILMQEIDRIEAMGIHNATIAPHRARKLRSLNSARRSATGLTWPCAPVARSASTNARAMRWKWCRNQQERHNENHVRRLHGRRTRRLSRQRGLRDLPHHPVFRHG